MSVGQPIRALHVVGARPQFPKLAAVRRAFRVFNSMIDERVVHSGQHYDHELSEIFFEELSIPAPDYNLGVGSGSNTDQTARTLSGVAEVIEQWRPEVVIVYGDTNATLAGALAAVQKHVRVAHVEAGVRTHNLHQAEELNRVVTDRISTWRFCCTEFNRETLTGEGLGEGTIFSGDPMLDNYRHFLPKMDMGALERLGLRSGEYALCTVHRAENTDHPERLAELVDSLAAVHEKLKPVVFPMHPRTRKAVQENGYAGRLESAGVRVIEPLGFNALQALLENSQLILSDSGGLQREAYFAGKRCVVLWEYASWPELVETGWALPGALDSASVLDRATLSMGGVPEARRIFGTGSAGTIIAETLVKALRPGR